MSHQDLRHPTRSSARARWTAGLAITLGTVVASPGAADAAGLYFPDRGVRPLGRGGAFIAGGDDLGSIAYNIAGAYDAGTAVFIDASWVNFSSDFTRQSIVRQVDPNTGEEVGSYLQTYPAVQGSTPFLPIPTLAASYQVHPQWVLVLGAWAPYAPLPTYPESVNGKPAPQRYSLVSLNGSALAFVGAAAAFAPSPTLRLGIGIGMLAGSFQSVVNMSGCVPDRFLCAAEDPEWDVLGEIKAAPILAPAGQIGAIFSPHPMVRLGLSFQSPVFVRAGATVRTRLPATPVFEQASQEGETAELAFDLPWNVRAGVELRPLENLRIELGGGFEQWSMHKSIQLTPQGIALKNVAAFPETYYLPPITLPRNFQDTFSVRLGGEYSFGLFGQRFDARLGVSYESSAVPNTSVNVLALDSDKITPSGGLSVHLGKARLDLVYAHIVMLDQYVDPAKGVITQVSPVNANPPEHPVIINGGFYSGRADIVGLGLTYTIDPSPATFAIPVPKADPPKPEERDPVSDKLE